MSTIKVVNMTGAEVGTVELYDADLRHRAQRDRCPRVVKNHLANCRQGTQSALTRVRGFRRRHEAVAPEGHRPRPSGQHPRSAVDARRHRVRPQAPRLQLRAEQEGQASGSASPSCPPRLPTARSSSSTRSNGRDQDQDFVNFLTAVRRGRQGRRRHSRGERDRRQERPQHPRRR